VLEGTWTFRKGEATLTLRRQQTEAGKPLLNVVRTDEVRELKFEDLDALIRFQSDMETFLVRTGWTLASFSPERRSARDRRTFPRETNDRRRWWTDSTSQAWPAETRARARRRFFTPQ
jgi:hypothetical protein